jgi:hypothetical protein
LPIRTVLFAFLTSPVARPRAEFALGVEHEPGDRIHDVRIRAGGRGYAPAQHDPILGVERDDLDLGSPEVDAYAHRRRNLP